ncbi:MAG: putative Ig domain-containing protein [Woeseia sp.]
MQRSNISAGKFWLMLFTALLLLVQLDAFAARPWSDARGKSGGGGPNKRPTIEGTPSSIAAVEQFYAFQPSANDRDGDTLQFSIRNRPAWAAFDTANGYLSGFPAESDAGSVTYDIAISVSDGKRSASLTPFSISVGEATQNSPPVISGIPAGEVMAMEAYNFTPNASDPDNDSLQFSVVSLPTWATFDAATGRLYGTPDDADLGLYENIRISVSDGMARASTDSFSIAVVHTTNGTVTLSWAAPTANTDGSPLIDLAGYRIYYGNVQGQYDHQLEISDAGVMTAVIDNLSQGAWYFAATALNSSGVESDLSGEMEILIQ